MNFNKFKRFVIISFLSLLCFKVFGQTTSSWYITQCKDKKVIEKEILGPYCSKEEAIAKFIYKKIPEKKNYCLSKNMSYITDSPSTYYRRVYQEVNTLILENLDEAIFKYNLNDDPERAAAIREEFQKAQEEKNIRTTQTTAVENTEPKENKPVAEVKTESKKEETGNTSKASETVQQTDNQNPSVTEAAAVNATQEIAVVNEQEKSVAVENNPVTEESKSNEIPFTLNLEKKSTVSRYRKEYLQDYITEDKYVAEKQNVQTNTIIKNPNETDDQGRTQLMLAAKSGNDWQIKNLILSNADINKQDSDGWTALMYAVRYQESIAVVRTLLNAGADVKILNNYEYSALLLAACYNSNPDILNLLLNYYSISEKEVLKAFSLMLSSKQISEYSEIAKLNVFIERSIPLNTFFNGKTPLMYAAQFCKSNEIIRILLENDALTGLRSTEGKTAFDYAQDNRNLNHDDIYWTLNRK